MGIVTVDVNSRLTRFIGTYFFAAVTYGAPRTVAVAGMANNGTWLVLITKAFNLFDASSYSALKSTVNSGSFTVTNIAGGTYQNVTVLVFQA